MIKLISVEVEWIDAHSSLDGMTISELEKAIPFLTKSCGYLVKEDKDKIILGFMLFGFNINDEPLLKHYQVIPKGMVRKITKLGRYKNRRTKDFRKSVRRNRTNKKTKRK